jgi:6-pyruvoyltetrahydropterin/6-carboxytetrahydropterin synthase
MWEVTKSFYFDAAHSLSGTTLGPVAEEVHGHSFKAEVAVEGTPDPATGMVMDLGQLDAAVGILRKRLDHKLLNNVEGLGLPTLENLARFICEQLASVGPVARVTISRESCAETCTYRPPRPPAGATAQPR